VGAVKADFSNSELLMSERGGIVFAGIPQNDLGKSLDSVGPLVTSISVNISPGGIETTYKMDLYTPRFGKLQAQREEALQKFGRQRQEQVDERNKAMRGAIKKGMTGSVNISNEISKYNDLIDASKSSSQFLSDFEKSSTYSDMMLGSVNTSNTIMRDEQGNPITHQVIGYDMSFTSEKNHQNAWEALPQTAQAGLVGNLAGGGINTFMVPSDQGIHHAGGMASRGYFPEANYQAHYYQSDNAGEVKVAQGGLPTANNFRNSSSQTSGGTKSSSGGTDPSMPSDSTNNDLGASRGRDGMGDLMGGGFGGDRATDGGYLG
jgi:hypothetical protein